MIPNFISVSSLVGPEPKHKLIDDDAHCEIIDGDGVVLTEQDFGGHVPRSAAGVGMVVWFLYFGNSKISQSQVPSFVENQVFRFYISVYDF